MSKIITSPVKRYSGTVTLQDPLMFPAFMAWVKAQRASEEAQDNFERAEAFLHGVCACVEKWEIGGLDEKLTPETFPATPVKPAFELLSWLIDEISKLQQDTEEIPNG